MTTTVFKIRKGKLETLQKWGRLLMTEYNAEALETLKEENCVLEAMYYFSKEGDDFAVFVLDFNGEKKQTNLIRKLNNDHRSVMKECLEFPAIKTEEVYKLF